MAILETFQYEDDIKKLVDVAVVKMKQYEQTSLGDGLITDELMSLAKSCRDFALLGHSTEKTDRPVD